MKKFMTISAITAAILIVVGLLIAVPTITAKSAQSISGVVHDVTDGKVDIKLNSLNDWGIVIGGAEGTGIGFDIHDNLNFEKGVAIMSGNIEQDYMADEIGNLDIAVGGCALTVKPSSDENFHLEGDNVPKMQAYVKDDGTLCIKCMSTRRITGLNFMAKTGTITLYVPEGAYFDNVNVELGAGAMEFEELSAGTASFEVGAGEIEFSGPLQAKKVKMEIGAGSITTERMDIEELAAEVGMGSLKLTGDIRTKAGLECSMGSIEMELDGSEEDYNFKLEASMGEIVVGDYTSGGLASEKNIQNGASCDISAECSMGSIQISFKE